MSNSTPRISVIMSVYNGETYLKEAIESILNQTYTDFEYIIINDGSTDKTAQILASYATDSRIKILTNQKNCGLPASLNRGLQCVRGEFIARMDSDDISLPCRFVTQVRFLDHHPTIGIVGSWAKTFGSNNSRIWKNPTTSARIKALLPFNCCLLHPTIMLRREVLEKTSAHYNEEFLSAQDYELWSQLWQKTEFANIPKVLLHYRINQHSISLTKRELQLTNSWRVHNLFLKQLKIEIDQDAKWLYNETVCPADLSMMEFLNKKEIWLQEILSANKRLHLIDKRTMKKTIHSVWFATCIAQPITWKLLKRYWHSSLCIVDYTFINKLVQLSSRLVHNYWR